MIGTFKSNQHQSNQNSSQSVKIFENKPHLSKNPVQTKQVKHLIIVRTQRMNSVTTLQLLFRDDKQPPASFQVKDHHPAHVRLS